MYMIVFQGIWIDGIMEWAESHLRKELLNAGYCKLYRTDVFFQGKLVSRFFLYFYLYLDNLLVEFSIFFIKK